MEKLLLIAIPDTAGVEQIAAKLRLRTVTVAPENYGKSLGSLAGYAAGTVPVSAETTLPETGLLVMCGLKNSRMDKLLAALRTAGIRIPHKAVLTPTNQNWNVYQLAQELERVCRDFSIMKGKNVIRPAGTSSLSQRPGC